MPGESTILYGRFHDESGYCYIKELSQSVYADEGDVIYTQDTHFEDYMETQKGKKLPVPHCIKGTEGWKLAPGILALCEAKNSRTVEKVTFGSKELPGLLKENYPEGLDEIELVGLCTDICVISNAMLLKAWFPEVKITVDRSCCAGVTPESHKNALEAMKMCQINIK